MNLNRLILPPGIIRLITREIVILQKEARYFYKIPLVDAPGIIYLSCNIDGEKVRVDSKKFENGNKYLQPHSPDYGACLPGKDEWRHARMLFENRRRWAINCEERK